MVILPVSKSINYLKANFVPDTTINYEDLQLLLRENTRLRELVVQLSRLVIRNAVDQK